MDAADFNGDGRVDLVQNSGTGLRIYYGAANGTFSSGTTIAGGLSGTSLVIGDFDGDGVTDVVSKNAAGITAMYRGGGNSVTFSTMSSISGATGKMVAGDFNHDGITDIVGVGTNSIKVALGNGNGGFSAAVSYTVEGTDSAVEINIGDFNGDGNIDLSVGGQDGSLNNYGYVLNNLGTGTFSSAQRVYSGLGGGLH